MALINQNLKTRYQAVLQSLGCLQESIEYMDKHRHEKVAYKIARNSAIQCFEFSIDTFWKFIQSYAESEHHLTIEAPTPKKVFRHALNTRIIQQDEFEIFVDMIDDRNITSHTYSEPLAEKVAERLPQYYSVLMQAMERMKLSD